jgi:subtilisin family serine protease
VFAVLLGIWIVATTTIVQVATWAVEQFLLVVGLAMPAWGWPLAVWANALVIGIPAILLARIAKRRALRAAGTSWALAALVLGIVGSLRAIQSQQAEIYFGSLAVLAALLAAVGPVTVWRKRRGAVPAPAPTDAPSAAPTEAPSSTPSAPPPSATPPSAPPPAPAPNFASSRWDIALLGITAGLAVLVPWMWVGALGGALESALALLAAAAVGWLAARVLRVLWAPLARATTGHVILTGMVAGTALVPLGAAIGGSGPHLAEMFMLPPLGFVAAALARRSGDWTLPIAGLLGAAALGPLAFVEADETTIIIGTHDVGYWAAIGAGISLAIAIVLAIVGVVSTRLGVGRTRQGRTWTWHRLAALTALVAVAATALVVYPLAGHPGFFGERLFVVMKTQADLSGLDQIADRDERLLETYRRLTLTADQTQAPLRTVLRRDGIGFTPYYLVNGIAVDGDAATRIWLSRRSDVDRVLLNPRLRPIPSVGGPIHGDAPTPAGPEWNITLIGADRVWATGDTGKGIVIGSSDTGVDGGHPALATAYRGGDDSWFDPWNHSRTPVDHNGHGTHTTGSAVGAGGIGVAPGAQWMACVNLGRDLGNPTFYLDCLQFMLAPFPFGGDPFTDGDPTRAADILTNSWGCPALEGCDERALLPAVNALSAAGIFFVAAAGNEGPRCSSIDDAPAPYASTFTVGAVDRDRDVADFSSRGPVSGFTKPDVVAPGVDVVSALPGGGYGALDGTSMATPQVAGVVALMWAASPALRGNVPRTAQILRESATPARPSTQTLGGRSCGGSAQTGSGLVDAVAAVAAARAVG